MFSRQVYLLVAIASNHIISHHVTRCAGSHVDLALNKPTEQSSSLDTYGNACALTGYDTPSWWLVDLQAVYLITSIRITTRYRHREHVLANFQVDVSTQHPASLTGFPTFTQGSRVCVKNRYNALPDGEVINFPCRDHIRGRFLRVVKYDYGPLAICKFEAYSVVSWRLKSLTPPIFPLVFTKISRRRQSRLQCARSCVEHTGKPCRLIRYHAVSSSCELIHSFQLTAASQRFAPQMDVYEVVA